MGSKRDPNSITLADRLFAAKYELANAKDDLFEELTSILGPIDYLRLTVDSYDSSFEAYEFSPFGIQPTKEQLLEIGELGFQQFWIYSIDERSSDRSTERMFYCHKPRKAEVSDAAE